MTPIHDWPSEGARHLIQVRVRALVADACMRACAAGMFEGQRLTFSLTPESAKSRAAALTESIVHGTLVQRAMGSLFDEPRP